MNKFIGYVCSLCKTEYAPEEVTYTCPQCGATTAYNVAAGGVACEHCGYVAPIQAQVVGQAKNSQNRASSWPAE